MTMPIVGCCTPILRYSPSGLAWYHAQDCPRDPNSKIFRPAKRQTEHLQVVQRGEDSRASVPTRIRSGKVHPPCKALALEGMPELVHGSCAWRMGLDTEAARYFDYHLDDAR